MEQHGVWVSIISHYRPNNVLKMRQKIGEATWYIGNDDPQEEWAYRKMGAEQLVLAGGLCASRNAALRDAFERGLPCLQLSDDIGRITRLTITEDGNKLRHVVKPFWELMDEVVQCLKQSPYRLGGISPNTFIAWNWYRNPIVHQAFILGDCFVCLPCELRFDEQLALKEDYDFTLQHIQQYGGVVRCNTVAIDFTHRTNGGGAALVRNSQTEQKVIRYLKSKWGSVIKDHPTRRDEILLDLKHETIPK